MSWQKTHTGGFYTALTPRAIEFGNGSDDRLAAVALAAWFRDFGIPNEWDMETLRFATRHVSYQDIEAKATRLTDPALVYFDQPSAEDVFVVRLTPANDIACVHGVTRREYWQDLSEVFPNGMPVNRLLRASDWLRLFPLHHHPCSEVMDWQKSQTASGEGVT